MLNPVLLRGWKDYDRFSSKLTHHVIKNAPHSKEELTKIIKAFESPFFYLNNIDVNRFIKVIPLEEILDLLLDYREVEPLTFSDIFPETLSVSVVEGKKSTANLTDLPEDKIQETLVDSLREKNATNCRGRAKDTSLEVADLEHFSVKVNDEATTFSCVVKGFKSISRKTVTWEKIAHQITKAYRTRPDHILVVLAKNPADSVISELIQYGSSINNPNLAVLCDPLELSRFLKARAVIP
ncbi:MAG: hypothetical protein NWF04_00060 [Candidatus Bathyarchaeota archaeon]|nr:hypothetical protein [Candidatus Bathyarchaeota archaeon]